MSPQKFTWPPKPPTTSAAAPSAIDPSAEPSQAKAPAAPRSTSLLRHIERTWLGLTTAPLAERIAEAGWYPDEPHAYCRRCGHNVGPHESDDTGCRRCRGSKFPWSRLVRLGPYSGLLRDVVREVKFTRWRRLGHELGLLLGRSLSIAIESTGIDPATCTLVPMPCSFRRRMARGIDHSLVLTRGVRAATGFPILHALTRSHRPTQLSLPAGQREANVRGSIRPRRGSDLADRFLILIDDVSTTRATLTAASRALLQRTSQSAKPPAGLWAAIAAITPAPGQPGRDSVEQEAGDAL